MSALSVVVRGHVATVTLDLPPVNALTHGTLIEIRDLFSSIADDRDVRVAIFTAAGDRAFIAGIDLKELEAEDRATWAPSRLLDQGRVAREAMWAVYDCAVPVIAAVNGPAIGAGVAFVAVADIIVAADTATFGTPEINVGLLGASAHLMLLVPRHRARELFFTGETITARELHDLGAVSRVVPRSKLMNAAWELAERLASKSPVALRLAKESMGRTEFLPLKEAYRAEQDYTARLLQFDDAAEARRAVLERRTPDWRWQ